MHSTNDLRHYVLLWNQTYLGNNAFDFECVRSFQPNQTEIESIDPQMLRENKSALLLSAGVRIYERCASFDDEMPVRFCSVLQWWHILDQTHSWGIPFRVATCIDTNEHAPSRYHGQTTTGEIIQTILSSHWSPTFPLNEQRMIKTYMILPRYKLQQLWKSKYQQTTLGVSGTQHLYCSTSQCRSIVIVQIVQCDRSCKFVYTK